MGSAHHRRRSPHYSNQHAHETQLNIFKFAYLIQPMDAVAAEQYLPPGKQHRYKWKLRNADAETNSHAQHNTSVFSHLFTVFLCKLSHIF